MNGADIDYAAVFQAFPGMVALLTPELVYAEVNEEYVRASGRPRAALIGRYLFDAFPDNPNDSTATGARNLRASLMRVLDTGERDAMALQRYDVESPERPGNWTERYWSPVNAPVLGPDGRVVLLVHRVEEVTELITARGGRAAAGPGYWRRSSTRGPASCRTSTSGCARPMPGSAKWLSRCRRRCCPPRDWWATIRPPCVTGPPWAR